MDTTKIQIASSQKQAIMRLHLFALYLAHEAGTEQSCVGVMCAMRCLDDTTKMFQA